MDIGDKFLELVVRGHASFTREELEWVRRNVPPLYEELLSMAVKAVYSRGEEEVVVYPRRGMAHVYVGGRRVAVLYEPRLADGMEELEVTL